MTVELPLRHGVAESGDLIGGDGVEGLATVYQEVDRAGGHRGAYAETGLKDGCHLGAVPEDGLGGGLGVGLPGEGHRNVAVRLSEYLVSRVGLVGDGDALRCGVGKGVGGGGKEGCRGETHACASPREGG